MFPVSAIGLRMVAAANLVEVAALVGDTARATMLNALMGGQSLTATELAYCANVSRSTASGHLSKLVAARLLTVIRNRRFSYQAPDLMSTRPKTRLAISVWPCDVSWEMPCGKPPFCEQQSLRALLPLSVSPAARRVVPLFLPKCCLIYLGT